METRSLLDLLCSGKLVLYLMQCYWIYSDSCAYWGTDHLRSKVTSISADAFRNTSSIIRSMVLSSTIHSQDLPCEEHQVTTEDGYILLLQRLPRTTKLIDGRSYATKQSNSILFGHGVMGSSTPW